MGVLTQELNRAPSIAELAARSGADRGGGAGGAGLRRRVHRRLAGAPTDEDRTLGDRLGGEDPALADVELHESLRPALATLPERERRILQLRFYGNQTQSQIAAQLGISQMHVSRLLARALAQLRGQLTEQPASITTLSAGGTSPSSSRWPS